MKIGFFKKKRFPHGLEDGSGALIDTLRYRMCNLIHVLPTVGSSTQTRDFQFIMLVWIKQVIIPVKHRLSKNYSLIKPVYIFQN